MVFEYQPIASEVLTQQSPYKRAESNLLAKRSLTLDPGSYFWILYLYLYIYLQNSIFIWSKSVWKGVLGVSTPPLKLRFWKPGLYFFNATRAKPILFGIKKIGHFNPITFILVV